MLILRKSSLILFAIIITSLLFAGCNKSSMSGNKQDNDNKQVKLRWVLGGPGKQQDSERVWAEFNNKLSEKLPNTTVEFEVIPFSDYAEKWKLIAASGEAVDLAWHGWMINYFEEVSKGSYLPLDDLINKSGKGIKAELPEWALEKQTVDGKLYSIPNYQMMVKHPLGLRTFENLSDKYFDMESATKVFLEWEKNNEGYLTQECFDVLDSYLEKLKNNNEIKMGVSPELGSWVLSAGSAEKIVANAYLLSNSNELKVRDYLDMPIALYENVNKWFEKGYIRKDVLTVQDYKKDIGKEKGYVIWPHGHYKGTAESESKKYGFPIEIIPIESNYYIPFDSSPTNTAISRTSGNPERAIKLLELMHTEKGKELYNMLVYGIEGEHYKKVSESRIETLAYNGSPTAESKYGLMKWVIGNTFNAYETQVEPEGNNEYYKNDVNGKAKISPIIGFKVDTDPIKVELAQYSAIEKEYSALLTGAMPNYKQLLTERNEKMKKAGSDKIVQEVQRQLDEWVKNNKK